MKPKTLVSILDVVVRALIVAMYYLTDASVHARGDALNHWKIRHDRLKYDLGEPAGHGEDTDD